VIISNVELQLPAAAPQKQAVLVQYCTTGSGSSTLLLLLLILYQYWYWYLYSTVLVLVQLHTTSTVQRSAGVPDQGAEES
jgi:transcriptional regulatory protein LevR